MAKEKLESALEQMIDSNSVYDVVHALEHIAYAKAIHLAENWQDQKSAKYYERLGGMFDKIGEYCGKFKPVL